MFRFGPVGVAVGFKTEGECCCREACRCEPVCQCPLGVCHAVATEAVACGKVAPCGATCEGSKQASAAACKCAGHEVLWEKLVELSGEKAAAEAALEARLEAHDEQSELLDALVEMAAKTAALEARLEAQTEHARLTEQMLELAVENAKLKSQVELAEAKEKLLATTIPVAVERGAARAARGRAGRETVCERRGRAHRPQNRQEGRAAPRRRRLRMGGAFNSLAWNADLDWWSSEAEFGPGHRIDLHVQAANEPSELRVAVARAAAAWQRLRVAEPAVREAVAGQMTEAHNDYCAPEDEVTEEQFAHRLRLKSALFEAAGSVELIYADGGQFGGHWIVVPVAADGTVGEASEAG